MVECGCLQVLCDKYGYNYDKFIEGFTRNDKNLFKERYGKSVDNLSCSQKDLCNLETFIRDIGPMHFSPLIEPNFVDWETFDGYC